MSSFEGDIALAVDRRLIGVAVERRIEEDQGNRFVYDELTNNFEVITLTEDIGHGRLSVLSKEFDDIHCSWVS